MISSLPKHGWLLLLKRKYFDCPHTSYDFLFKNAFIVLTTIQPYEYYLITEQPPETFFEEFHNLPKRNERNKKDKLKELFTALYGKQMIEKEILYYNFIEREVQMVNGVKEFKDQAGRLISPRPKQKFGTDKIIAKIDEFLTHENDPEYFERLLEKQLTGVGETKRKELLEKRKTYSNNKNVYSLLMQYAAGFGKSNIIGWSALQLKDLRRPDSEGKQQYVYDKIMIVVDRLQLRSQIDSLLLNMNIDRQMVLEAKNRKTFQAALESDTRLVIVNLQKFGAVREMLDAGMEETCMYRR